MDTDFVLPLHQCRGLRGREPGGAISLHDRCCRSHRPLAVPHQLQYSQYTATDRFSYCYRQVVERLVPPVAEKEVEMDQPQYLDKRSKKYPQTAIKALTDESIRLLENAAYKILAHGLGVHREDLESGKKLKDILKSSNGRIEIDIEQVYASKIKSIYSQILEYATELQTSFHLNEDEVEKIRNILVADRLLSQVVKRMKPMHKSLNRYIDSENKAIRKEYNALRLSILKVVREIHRIGPSENIPEHLEKLHKKRGKAMHLDALQTGRVEELLREGAITRDMATSLIDDSSNAARITKNLVDIALILYRPTDTLIDKIDERNAKQYPIEQS